jgi:hypothetical protein
LETLQEDLDSLAVVLDRIFVLFYEWSSREVTTLLIECNGFVDIGNTGFE